MKINTTIRNGGRVMHIHIIGIPDGVSLRILKKLVDTWCSTWIIRLCDIAKTMERKRKENV